MLKFPARPKTAFVVIVFLSLILGGCKSGDEHSLIPLTYSSIDFTDFKVDSVLTQSGARVWREGEPTLLASISDREDAPLFKISGIAGDASGNVYVFDSADFLIKKYDRDGEPGTIYGAGQGEGPGEINRGGRLRILGDSLLAVMDRGSREIDFFRVEDGSYSHSQDYSGLLVNFAFGQNGGIYTKSAAPGRLFKFSLRDSSAIFPDQSSDGMIGRLNLDGYLSANRLGMVYLPKFYGVLLQYSSNGDLLYAAETIGPGDHAGPEIVVREVSGRTQIRLAPGFDQFAAALSVSGESIYIQAINTAPADSLNTVIDVYRARDGRYDHSFRVTSRISARVRTAIVQGEYLYMRRDTTLTTYTLRGLGKMLEPEPDSN